MKKRNKPLWAGLILLGVLLSTAILCPYISPYDPLAVDLERIFLPPSLQHPMGTDNFGRDILTRVLYGTRVDLKIGFLCVLFPFIIGTTAGCVSGYVGGAFDALMMRIVDVVYAFPFYVLIIAIVGLLGSETRNIYLAITMVSWVTFARIVRGEVLVAKQSEYVLAAKALGYSRSRIMFLHLLPNVITPAIVFSMSDVVLTILAITSLSFLGLGIQPPTPEWGLMVSEGRMFILDAWWISTFPGLAIVVTGITFTFLADGIDDMLRPGA